MTAWRASNGVLGANLRAVQLRRILAALVCRPAQNDARTHMWCSRRLVCGVEVLRKALAIQSSVQSWFEFDGIGSALSIRGADGAPPQWPAPDALSITLWVRAETLRS